MNESKDSRSTASKMFDAVLSSGYGLLWLVVVIIGVVGLFLPGGFWYGLGVIAIGGYFAYRNFSTMFRP
jgi:hypothetical protein